ncbi:hypothetical protein [Kribbella speibonae]|uniref:Uncharacterized protein n=1 Tax=Kribbella speibonae TaxID=1572660 RepID=A0A4R0IUW9_9ACTN|nr:hypothetical protein [Kribbella speibonae]TCC36324.1 hypothetical protein E0H92_27110 [Kribbella speibonae]
MDGVDFEARFSGSFRPGRLHHDDRQALVRHEVLEAARDLSRSWSVDDVPAAQDALNAELGRPSDCAQGFYRRLVVQIELDADPEAVETAARHREDRARIARLRYLRSALYTDPELLLIDHLDRNPDTPIDRALIDRCHAVAGELSHAKEWWAPLLTAWNELAMRTAGDPDKVDKALEVLLTAIRHLDAKLIDSSLGVEIARQHSEGRPGSAAPQAGKKHAAR